ncbi:MAG: class 1 fructose-bisphosphatase [Oligoflexia bacterium]|nr:class 1 fructose-bisphosphatase [Oligoflexia bacterium]
MTTLQPCVPTSTLTRFILQQERRFPSASGELSDLLNSISLGTKMIAQLVATAGFRGLQGYTGKTNVQGEATQKLDEESDKILHELLGSSGHFGLLVSEERDTVQVASEGTAHAKYVVAFDPLDGSSNLGSNIPVGTIFSIWRKRSNARPAAIEDFYQSGRNLVAAGYTVYGAKTSFVYSSGQGVHGFTLDPTIGEFILTEEEIRSPERGKTYSVNEGNALAWDAQVGDFVAQLKSEDKKRGTPYAARYVGSLVADFDRNLKRGGVFLYPADKKNANGKLRLLYECMPLAYIAEQAGGRAIDGKRNVLDIVPSDIHERCPFIVGSKYEVDWFESLRR